MNPTARPTLLLLPGTLCDERLFAHQRRALRPMVRIEVGNLHRLDEPAAWVARLLERMPPRFSVAGFSLGGLLALEILRQAPSRVERLALVASNVRGASSRGQRRSAQLWRRWRVGGPQGVIKDVLPQYFPKRAPRERHRALVTDMARRTPGAAAKAQFQWAAARPEGRSVLAGFAGPLCVVSGMRDKLCPHAWQQEIAAIHPHAQWTALPRVGHFLPLEAPVPLSRALAQWLQSPVTPSFKPQPSDPYA